MSIEEKIEGLTAAITNLTVQVSALVNNANFGNVSAAAAIAMAKEDITGQSTSETKKPRKSKAEKAETKPDPIDEFEDVTETKPDPVDEIDDLGLDEEAAPAITQEELKKVVAEVSKKKGRETVLKLFKKFEIATFADVKPEQYAAMHKDATALLGG